MSLQKPKPKNRSFSVVALGGRTLGLEVMIYGGSITGLRPMVIVNSLHFPSPPSVHFCRTMQQAGFQVIFVRRPGYGASFPLPEVLMTREHIQNGAAAVTEATILNQLFTTLGLRDAVLVAMGSANPVCYRLLQICPHIAFAVLENPMFNQDIWDAFHPEWLRPMLQQIIKNRSGLWVAEQGLKHLIKRDPIRYYRMTSSKSEGDCRYIAENQADFTAASSCLLMTAPAMLYYDVIVCMTPDASLKDTYFDSSKTLVLIGRECTDVWRTGMYGETKRLGLEVAEMPQGHLFAPYQSPDAFVKVILDRM